MSVDPGVPTPIGALAARYRLSAGQRDQAERLVVAVAGDPLAPTAIRDPEQIVERHLADSLAAIEIGAVAEAGAIADIGSGVGFPGLALAIAMPHTSVSLVEAQRRRCEFLARACAAAATSNATPVLSRAEEWSEGIAANDVVVARALAPQPVVLEYAAPLLRPMGVVVDWRGTRSADEEAAGDRAAAELGLRRESIERVTPFGGARDLHLHVFTKIVETPSRFPRRAGMAGKRPIGS